MADTQNTHSSPRTSKSPQNAERDSNDQAAPPPVFKWYENLVEQGLEALYKQESSQQNRIHAVIYDMADSPTFWKLQAAFDDAFDAVRGDVTREGEVLRAMFARFYIAGSLRKLPVLDNDLRW